MPIPIVPSSDTVPPAGSGGVTAATWSIPARSDISASTCAWTPSSPPSLWTTTVMLSPLCWGACSS